VGDVVDAVSAAGGPALDKRSVQLTQPIKTTGAHAVVVKLHPEVDATIELDVTAAS
ncbi:MAG TPA: 50S ribosomal L9 C-terminal domain-containing protein, partial [Actinomycetes bacterium]|nr:50S ribosomal L9 C-terminal domain-containing protein [Actinomycetes bacterium]